MTVQKHNDKTGWKRGLGHYSRDDPQFDAAKYHRYDSFNVTSKYSAIMSNNGPSGPMLPGGAPVSKGGPPKFKAKRGPIGNMERPK